jgi:hypothetical protein
LVVVPVVFDPEDDTADVIRLGAAVAAVVDDVSVLEDPPLTVGWTLTCGWTMIIGSTVITGAETASETPVILSECARPSRPWLAVWACRPEVVCCDCVCC